MKSLMILIGVLMLAVRANAQVVKITHDTQKEKQWKSMENGPWDFEPAWYYFFLHNSYSGAEKYWKWQGFKSGFRIRFKENKSSVKRIMPSRIAADASQQLKLKKVNEEEALVKGLYEEELVRQADREVDLMYARYKDDFNSMQSQISDGLIYCIQKSKGKMKKQVDHFSKENEIICQNIAYIHKTGIGNELENVKRQKAYIQAKEDMQKLAKKVAHLVALAEGYY